MAEVSIRTWCNTLVRCIYGPLRLSGSANIKSSRLWRSGPIGKMLRVLMSGVIRLSRMMGALMGELRHRSHWGRMSG
jgi:hypothetical protein